MFQEILFLDESFTIQGVAEDGHNIVIPTQNLLGTNTWSRETDIPPNIQAMPSFQFRHHFHPDDIRAFSDYAPIVRPEILTYFTDSRSQAKQGKSLQVRSSSQVSHINTSA